MIPDSFKQDLLNRVDIVDVISARLPLKKSGANWVGLCPFHGEKTPSFTVSQSKQFYHCFGCGAHGNAIGFLMEYAGLGYVEAVKDLADGAGLKLPEGGAGERRRTAPPEGPDLYELLAVAGRYYREQLKGAPRAIEYLKGRGLAGKTAARFGIGYAPAGWQNLAALFPRYEDKALVECGLVIENEGKRYDRFRDRVLFPIVNQRGLVVGFGGRVIEGDDGPPTGEGQGSAGPAGEGKGSPGPTGEGKGSAGPAGEGKGSPGPTGEGKGSAGPTGEGGKGSPGPTGEGKGSPGPKYLNSPETPVFEKGRELYGLPQAREAIRAASRVVVVEGYMDVVMLAQHGVENAVATLGTATTHAHVQKLLRQADDVVFCFDGDAAGRRAAWHALEVSLESLSDRKAIRFLFLPAEHDPDSYVRASGREAFAREVAEAQPLSAFLLSSLTGRADLSTFEGRSRLIAEASPLVRRVAAPALRIQLLKALADAAALSPVEVARLMDLRDGVVSRAERVPPARDDRGAARRSNEAKLLRAILALPELASEFPVESLTGDAPDTQALQGVLGWLADPAAEVVPRPLSGAFGEASFYGLLTTLEADLLDQQLDDDALRVEFAGGVQRLRERALDREIKVLEQKARSAGLAEHERAAYSRLIREQAALRQPAAADRLVHGPGTPI